jgi:hypothetical protein
MIPVVQALNQLSTNALFVAVSGLASILSIVLAIVLYRLGRERYEIGFRAFDALMLDLNNVKYDGGKITVVVNEKEVDRLTSTYILVKNFGTRLVDKSELVGAASIKCAAHVDIVNYQLLAVDDRASGIDLRRAEDRILIDFDFLRPGDGFLVRVDHTGTQTQVFVELATRTGGPIKRKKPGGAVLAFFPSAVCLGAGLLYPVVPFDTPGVPSWLDRTMAGLFTGFFYFMVLVTVLLLALIAWKTLSLLTGRAASSSSEAEFSAISIEKDPDTPKLLRRFGAWLMR